MKKVALLFSIFTLAMATSFAVVVFEDDFESYADNTALTSAYDANTITGLISSPSTPTLDLKSVANPHADAAGTLLAQSWTAVNSTDNTVTVTYWAYDSAGDGPGATGSASLNGRAGLSLAGFDGGAWGSGALENYIFLGMYHSAPASPLFYAYRVVSGSTNAGAGGWAATSIGRTVGWHKFTIELNNGTAAFYVDDVLAATDTYSEPPAGWSSFRLGSPAGQTFVDTWYDNVEITAVKSTVLAANDGSGDYLTIQEAISSFCAGGDNDGAPAPYTVNIKPTGTPYNERITLNSARTGFGDILGDITLQSSVPGTHPELELQRSTGEASGISSSGIQIYQNEHNVTLRDLLIYPSITGEIFQRYTVKIDENSANSTFNTIRIENCIITEVADNGQPLITSRTEAYDPPTSATGVGRASSFTQAVQVWGDGGESIRFEMEDSVLYGPPDAGGQTGNLLRLILPGQDGESAYLRNNVMAYGPTSGALMRVGTGNQYSSTIIMEGGDQTAGLDDTNVFIANNTSGHAITFEGSLNGGSADTGSTVSLSSAVIIANSATPTQRAISSGTEAWKHFSFDNMIIDANGAAVVAFQTVDGVMSNVTANSNQTYFGLGGAGSLTVEDSIFTGVDTVAADGKFGGTAPSGGVSIDFSGFGADVVNPIGTTVTGTFTLGSNIVNADPLYAGTDFKLASFFDVQNNAYAAAGTGGSDLAGGANYLGPVLSVGDWMNHD